MVGVPELLSLQRDQYLRGAELELDNFELSMLDDARLTG
jgi:hypothetical protein